jgi:tetratricopeptide (TPR) repeat protein
MRIIINRLNFFLNVLRHVIDLFAQVILSQQDAKRAEQLSNNGKFLEAVSLANKILERWSSPSPSFLERQFSKWVMSDRLKQLREQLNTWQTDALIEYNAALRQAHQIAVQGRFQDALAQFEPVHHQFPQAGGLYLLRELRRIVDGKRHFHQGLLAEKAGDFQVAAEHYQNAIMYVPQLRTHCCIRLAILAVKMNNWTEALSHLEGISGEQAAYIRGFAYTKQENWQSALQEWQFLSHPGIQQQCEVLNTLVQIQEKRDRLLAMRKIEQYIDTGNIEAAESASKNFIQKFGHDPLVDANLNEHIMPRLEAAAWEERDWLRIAKIAEQRWINQQDVTSLHNWVVASYYQAQTDSNQLADLIIAWSTDLANLHRNPSLVNLPWRKNTLVNWGEVALDLKQKIEEKINTLADENQKKQLRELLRLDTYALELMGNPPKRGMIVNDVFLTPGCYQRHRTQLNAVSFLEDPDVNADDTNRLLETLYTVWGSVVVACQDGDLVRVLQIKPGLKVSCDIEQFAYKFVSYHEGCYRLQNNRWREAIVPLRQARSLIKANAYWYERIDRLCETRCQAIETIDEYQDFIQSWDDLLDSPTAKRYLLEIKAIKIRALRTNGNFREAIWELQKLRYSQKYNPVLLDLTTSFIDLLRDDRGLLLSFEDTRLICDWAWELQSDEPTFPVPELCYRLRRVTGG